MSLQVLKRLLSLLVFLIDSNYWPFLPSLRVFKRLLSLLVLVQDSDTLAKIKQFKSVYFSAESENIVGPICNWSPWINSFPKNRKDFDKEVINQLKIYGFHCPKVFNIEARDSVTKENMDDKADIVIRSFSINRGFECYDSDQGESLATCPDVDVRFCCYRKLTAFTDRYKSLMLIDPFATVIMIGMQPQSVIHSRWYLARTGTCFCHINTKLGNI